MKYFKNWNISKAIMLWIFIAITIFTYFWLLPNRPTFWFGGEIFMLGIPFFINYIPEAIKAGKDLLRELDDIICVWLNDNFGGE